MNYGKYVFSCLLLIADGGDKTAKLNFELHYVYGIIVIDDFWVWVFLRFIAMSKWVKKADLGRIDGHYL